LGKEKSAIYIIGSPFQALCAIEAKNHFNCFKNDFFITYLSDKIKKKSTIINIFNNFGIYVYQEIILPKYFYYLKYVITNLLKNTKYDYIFIGDYYNTAYYLLALTFKKKGSKIIFLDDGNSSIEAFNFKFKYAIERGIAYYLRYLITKTLCSPLFKNSDTFFSIFSSTETNYFNVISNNFEVIRANVINKNTNPDNIVIIGTNLVEMGLYAKVDYLKLLVDAVQKYPQIHTIFYYPHRGESEIKLNEIKKILNIIIKENNTCIELEIIKNSISPKLIIGFGSTALFSLKMLYPNSVVVGYILNMNADYQNVIYADIWKEYTKQGIKIIDLSDENLI